MISRTNVYASLLRRYRSQFSAIRAASLATTAYYRLFGELPYYADRPNVLEFRLEATPEIIAAVKGMTPQEAVRYLASKGITVSAGWRDMDASAHQKAFTVAKVASADALVAIKGKLEEAIAKGQTLEEWKKEIVPKLKDHETALTPGKLQNIYRTNVQSAMMAGRKSQMDSTADDFPYRQFVAIDDNSTTNSCKDLNGKVARSDDPFWQKYTPPLHHGCRSNVRSLTESQLKREGLEVSEGRDLEPLATIARETGFDAAPTMEQWEPPTAKYEPELRAAVETAIAKAAEPPTWADQVTSAKASGITINPKDEAFIKDFMGEDVNLASMTKALSFDGGNNVMLRNGTKVEFEARETIVKKAAGGGVVISSTFTYKGKDMQVKRTLSRDKKGNLIVDHDLLEIPKELQKNGIAQSLWRDCLAEYDKAGVKEVKVYAALDGGHHTWAKFGFDFEDEYQRDEWRERFNRHLIIKNGVNPKKAIEYTSKLKQPRDFQKIHKVEGVTVDGNDWKENYYKEPWSGVLKLDGKGGHKHLLKYLGIKKD